MSGGAQALQPALGDLFGDEDAGHGVHAYRQVPTAPTGPRTTFAAEWNLADRPDDSQLGAIEEWFVARGLPHFVERRPSIWEIWGRAIPLLVVAYLLLGLNALDLAEWTWLGNVLAAAFVVAVLV